jgi:hypothetical protein
MHFHQQLLVNGENAFYDPQMEPIAYLKLRFSILAGYCDMHQPY